MELLTKLEHIVAGWMKHVPHLPVYWRKWLGNNAWWIVVIGIFACMLSILSIIGALTEGRAYVVELGLARYAPSTTMALTNDAMIMALIFLLAEALLLIAAVDPLRKKQRRGWTLFFAAYAVGTLAVVVDALFTLSIAGFIIGVLSGLVGIAIGAYFLFEIRGEFMKRNNVKS